MSSSAPTARTRPRSAPSGAERQPRSERPQLVFVVDRTERLSPHLVRVHLGGPAFDLFLDAADRERLAMTDKYVKILFARPELGLVPPYDFEALRTELAADDLPVRRTYTVRTIDRESHTIAIDFVIHGDEGVAGPWAAGAQTGDLLALSGPGGQYSPVDDPESMHLLLGDDSAIPAIAAALEAMPATASGLTLIEVEGAEDEVPLNPPAGVKVRWLHRANSDTQAPVASPGVVLSDAVLRLDRPDRPVRVFAHGERAAMKAIGGVLQRDWGLDRRSMSLSAYWAMGRAEDRFQAEKREPVGQVFDD